MLKRRRDQIRASVEGLNRRFSTPPVARYAAPSVMIGTRARVAATLLSEIEDRRRFNPAGPYAPPATFGGRGSRKIVERLLRPSKSLQAGSGFMPASRLGFAVPEKVAVCVRRKRRREVLFAVKGTGKGARAKRTYNYFSSIDC